ncbi:MAG: dipeptidase PepE [bacterium]
MRLLLSSSSKQHGSGYLDHCADEIIDFLGQAKQVAFIPFALHDWEAYSAAVAARFRKMEFDLSGVHQAGDARGTIAAAEAIFVGGGNTFRLLNELYNQDLLQIMWEKVASGTPYIGSSAGTGIAGPTIKTTNDMPIVYPPSFDALNLVPFNLNCHYLDPDPKSRHQGETREQRLKEFHEMNDPPVLALREGAMLRVEGKRATLKGNVNARLFLKARPPVEFEPGADLSFLLS